MARNSVAMFFLAFPMMQRTTSKPVTPTAQPFISQAPSTSMLGSSILTTIRRAGSCKPSMVERQSGVPGRDLG